MSGISADRRAKGIGLGLSITRRLVALHGGVMTVESQSEQGSTFHIYLPLPNLSGRPLRIVGRESLPVLVLLSKHDQVPGVLSQQVQRAGDVWIFLQGQGAAQPAQVRPPCQAGCQERQTACFQVDLQT